MSITFYPYEEDLEVLNQTEKLEVLLDAAGRYKSVVIDAASKLVEANSEVKKCTTPRELVYAYNWEELAKILREIRDLPENNHPNRLTKAERLSKLAEVYEVLRGAKMPKLEAVRLALVNEANQLRAGSATSIS